MLSRFVFVVLFAALLGACNVAKNTGEAEAAISVFHADYNEKNYAGIWQETSAKFREVSTETEFSDMLESSHLILGKMTATDQIGWKAESNLNGSFLVMTQQTKFENGVGTEVFTFEDGKHGVQLVGYNLNSDDLMAGLMKRAAQNGASESAE